MVIVFYVSSHGYGHASRSVELIRALRAARPNLHIAVKTAAPRWMFDALPGVSYEHLHCDTGLAQIDSLTIDLAASVRNAAEFYASFEARVAAEASFLRLKGARIVLGDIPPLAHAAAARAGVPSIAIGNFTWDWIYDAYPEFQRHAPGVVDLIGDAYGRATRALRLPMHGGFASIADIIDVPMIARRSTRSREETRGLLGIAADRPFVLASFSGSGPEIAFDQLAAREGLTVRAPAGVLPAPLEFQDLVAAADLVISKPGYGIVSECAANRTPLLYTSRGHFVEYDVFVAEMPRVLRCRFIPQDDLRAGRWRAHVDALLAQPEPPERARVDGAAVATAAIVDVIT